MGPRARVRIHGKSKPPQKRFRNDALQGLVSRLDARGIARDLPLAHGKGPKISAHLGQLIRSFVTDRTDIEEYRMLANLGLLAWNWAIEPELVSREKIDSIVQKAEPELRACLYETLEVLKFRKLMLFRDDRRLILGAEAHLQSDGGFYLVVSAAVQE